MTQKTFRSKHIRKQLESLYQKEFKAHIKPEKPIHNGGNYGTDGHKNRFCE